MLVHVNVTESALEHTDLSSSGIPDIQRTVASIVDHHVNTPVIADSENGAEGDIRRSSIVSTAGSTASRHLSSVAIPVAIESCRGGGGGAREQHYQADKNVTQDAKHSHPSNSNQSEDVTLCCKELSRISLQTSSETQKGEVP